MRILYFGTSSFALPTLQVLIDHQYPLTVVTQPDRPAGRGSKLTPSPVKTLALQYDLPVLQPESCRTPEFLEIARQYEPDLTVVAAYGQFLPDALLSLPRHGSVNLHGSLLPKYRGAAPIQRAIWDGETRTGVSLMWMARAMDAGDVIDCTEMAILPEDTAGTLTDKLALCAADLLLYWLPALEADTAPHHPQDPALVTFAPPLRKEERPIDWTRSAEEIGHQVRALAPQPGATALFHDLPLKILLAQPALAFTQEKKGIPGTIVEIDGKMGLYVATGNGILQIRTLQPAGKRPMSSGDFLRGYPIVVGEQFTS